TSQSALFLEALCAQTDALVALERLTSRSNALDTFQRAMLDNVSIDFLNVRCTKVLEFLQHPLFEVIDGGSLLAKAIRVLASPRTLLTAYQTALSNSSLGKDAQIALAWLMIQCLAAPECASEERDLAQAVCDDLQKSTHHELRARATAIERSLQQSLTTCGNGMASQAGGRHDNDFTDFKEIAILPTAEEVICAKPPHLLTALALTDVPKDTRPSTTLDNQFRLLREDMLYELREDLQKHAQVKGKGGRRKGGRGFEIEGLRLYGVSGTSGEKGRR
ncbi:hypothetical protein BKA62DRAFT_586090, partial [Auriculariales sp. MPI-PUGE-AT-0066]